ncbi:protein FAM184A-like [Haliotis rufescens]|uniref:protein FAM184A-like n=1 Tax=Haliotis rufescens TaxID=6454 RepID=UPI00201EAC95|nr:protein FAM184A-like [Haliotis rufescens]XP_046329621.2 protein FAM184A-like [Haliotis rufescens]XP_046329622.2 protein FAM184A-like [Haliotis rufescens]XP_046329623.2 protein FAM184A-like [Haliotis rufescens]
MEKQRRSFEFRMSKKVAELTQVVHMLFTRNHEKEVEIDAVKEAYELEIQNIIEDAGKRLSTLQSDLEDMRSRAGDEGEKMREMMKQEYMLREAELARRLADSEQHLVDERKECQNIRDLLINAQKDIEQLRHGVAEQLNLKSDEIAKRDREIERLRKQVALLEKGMKVSEKETNSAVRDFEKSNEKLETELTHMHELLEESHRVKDQLLAKVKVLETELKNLKRDFNRRVTETVASQVNKMPRSAPSYTNHNEELERLRREIQRYRLELSNRDSNFNRVFTTQQPVIVDPRSAKSGAGQSPQPNKSLNRSQSNLSHGQSGSVIQNGLGQPVLVNGYTKPGSRNHRNTAVPTGKPHFSSTIQTYYEELNPSPRPNSASSQLPSIASTTSSADGRSRSQKFSKPRPLPKEMLFSK